MNPGIEDDTTLHKEILNSMTVHLDVKDRDSYTGRSVKTREKKQKVRNNTPPFVVGRIH